MLMKTDKSKMARDTSSSIKLYSAGLEDKGTDIAANGWLDLDGIKQILIDSYQREVLTNRSKIMRALERGERLPTIILGMRGQRFHSHGDNIFLDDPVYVIDGLQRISNIIEYARRSPEEMENYRIAAEVRFSTTRESEIDLFNKLNVGYYKTALSPNVILRNSKEKNASILTLFGLTENTVGFPLYKRVQWSQQPKSNDLLTALTLCRIMNGLHRRFLPSGQGAENSNNVVLGDNLDRVARAVGLSTFRKNAETFFDLLQAAWGLGHLKNRQDGTQTKGNFLRCLARILSDHDNFWRGKELVIPIAWERQFKKIPVDDVEIRRLSAAGNSAVPLLLYAMISYMNKGKRVDGSSRLIPTKVAKDAGTEEKDRKKSKNE